MSITTSRALCQELQSRIGDAPFETSRGLHRTTETVEAIVTCSHGLVRWSISVELRLTGISTSHFRGIFVELWDNSKKIDEKQLDNRGSVEFKNQWGGTYKLKFVIPK